MKPEIKKIWVEALRSGEYKQGTGNLRNGDEYCCLGVLCDVIKKDLGLEGEIDGSSTILSDEITDYCGLNCVDPSIELSTKLMLKMGIKEYGRNYKLAYLNDIIRLDFNQIADLIEQFL